MARPVLIVHSNLPIIQILCSHLSSQFQVILSDYSNDYDLFNSKEVFISAVCCKTSYIQNAKNA